MILLDVSFIGQVCFYAFDVKKLIINRFESAKTPMSLCLSLGLVKRNQAIVKAFY